MPPFLDDAGVAGRVLDHIENGTTDRSMKLADGNGCSKAFVCRYDGWTYQLDGQLRHIPGDFGFPNLDQDSYGLVLVDAEEKGGLLWGRAGCR
ncbi:unnamed protein product [marine sediment metagenome]|uniref:Rieske domain-containing protein n=1 Tax=marine sediment metagenome TaxID=412755 RepID=X0VBE1_9ZZZZ